LLPLASWVLLLFIGKRMGDPLAGWVATACAIGSFALSMAGMIAWYNGGQLAGMTWGPGDKPIELGLRWLPLGAGVVDVGVHIDTLTVAMFNTITLVVALTHGFAVRFLARDKSSPAFFCHLQLLSFSTLALFIAGNLLQIFIFWQLMGLACYLLTGARNGPGAYRSAAESFIVNRIADIGFLVGMGILFYLLGNVSLMQLDRWLWPGGLASGAAVPLPDGTFVTGRMLTIVGIALFCAAIGKSALFPLHVWLPDSVAAPIPASALIQSVTITAAGVYLMARIFPILTPDAKLFMIVIGLVTLVMAALIALAQRDLARVLAFSTISQMGLIMMALGIGSWVGALFHLVTHAFFKALLVLAAGSVIGSARGEQRLDQFGGLIRKIPVTAVAFAVGLLALSAAPFTSGYYSQEMILVHAAAFANFAAGAAQTRAFWLLFIVPTAITGITALYMTRCWMLIFWGKPRNQMLFEAAREHASFWFPLMALAVLSLVGGSRLLDIKVFIAQSAQETENQCNAIRDPSTAPFGGFQQTWPIALDQAPDAVRSLQEKGDFLFRRYAIWPFAAGIALGYLIYCPGYAVMKLLCRLWPVRIIRAWFLHGMFFNELYCGVFVAVMMAAGRAAAAVDRLLFLFSPRARRHDAR
jgi:NADH:ubiquinone oxidoreductase subunit 5 (subunit L)/multisubunit Na+/H+ antiporter MnhA subunit